MEKIRKHIENLFIKAAKTSKVEELKVELIADLIEKYSDLIEEGKSEAEAYESVISGIGDIDELLMNLGPDPLNYELNSSYRKKTALVVTSAIALYIISIISVIVCNELFSNNILTVVPFFLIAGLATCILVYHYIQTPRYKKSEDTVIEEFKEWKGKKDLYKDLKNTVSTIMWLIIVIIYLFISFIMSAWAYSWIIFIIGAAIEEVIKLLFKIWR